MKKPFLVLTLMALLAGFVFPSALLAQTYPTTVVWSEPDLPSADSPAPSAAQLAEMFPGARLASVAELAALLSGAQTRLLVLPQASVFPEYAWPAISDYLHRGGNLLVIGGRPFTRAAFRDRSGWRLRDYSTRFTRVLLIDQYQPTPGSAGAEFTANPEISLDLPHFSWQQAYSPTIRLSTSDLYSREGSAGGLDVRLDALVWGVSQGRRISAPVLEVDHLSSGFAGGRWIFLTAELSPFFYATPESTMLFRALAHRALAGAEEFHVRPLFPLYLPGEPIELETVVQTASKPVTPFTVEIRCYPEDQPEQVESTTVSFPASANPVLPAPSTKGFHIIEARLLEGTALRAIYHSAFWIRDEDYLRSGPRLGLNQDYFTRDGKPLAVVGTTYMSSEVQRLYFDHPNAFVWNEDMSLVHSAGLNMLRTGWWTGWDKVADETGRPYERTLRTLEAYLMTARKFGLPVQFTFFAFLPDVFGGRNAYLDPAALRKQQTLVAAVAARFREVPFLAWDLVNEPSFSKQLWKMRPNYDEFELAAWNAWLSRKYPDRAALAQAWNVLPEQVAGTVPLPSEEEFLADSLYTGINSLRVYDYYEFAQETFADWVRGMQEAIRTTGAGQPITVGQDEGGALDRLNPAFFAPYVDFTTTHSWWQNDALLWDSLVAKQPLKPMLVQETGLQRELTLEELARRTPGGEAALLERKLALSFAQGSGAIEWLWNANPYMTESNETPIGALRADLTEKPEAKVLRDMAKFAADASPYLRNPKPPDITIVTSQAAQFSVLGELQILAQQNAVRALGYSLHQPCSLLAEDQIGQLGAPKLVILPSPQALSEATWDALVAYVKKGGHLLVTGPVSRDEHWHAIDRLSPLGIKARTEPLTFHTASLKGSAEPSATFPPIFLSFGKQQQKYLEVLRFADGATLRVFPVGLGLLYLAAYPVELSDNAQAAAELYVPIVERAGIPVPFEGLLVGDGLLVYPIELEDGVLYIFASESDEEVQVSLKDTVTGGELKLKVAPGRGVLALIDKQSKQVVAQYGF